MMRTNGADVDLAYAEILLPQQRAERQVTSRHEHLGGIHDLDGFGHRLDRSDLCLRGLDRFVEQEQTRDEDSRDQGQKA